MRTVLTIPTYNGREWLEKLIPQALEQDFYKIYILDDNSTDDSRELYEKYPQLNVIYGDKNVGPGANRNPILSQDMGDIIFFLDDDMSLDTTDVPKILSKLFDEHSGLAI